jgi:deaminated glutathione amidase
MSDVFKVACVQTNSPRDVAPSIEQASDLIRQARDAGADFITTPECVNLMEPKGRQLREKIRYQNEDECLMAFQKLAEETGAWLLAGSLMIRIGDDKAANRSFLIGPDGDIKAQYDKIHMFDVDLGNGEFYRESKLYEPGKSQVLADLPWGKLGMTICYDVRFPHLYRAHGHAGADFITVPAAFTRTTGKAHWHVLLRSRAIENGCFIFAAAQTGEHAEGRETYGHSLIVDPWGEVLADGGEGTGFVIADIDVSKVAKARGKVPSLTHDRAFNL